MTKIEQAFTTVRGGIQADIQNNAFDRQSAAMALAMVDIAEELLSKLERIAVANEALANAVDPYDGRSIRTSAT